MSTEQGPKISTPAPKPRSRARPPLHSEYLKANGGPVPYTMVACYFGLDTVRVLKALGFPPPVLAAVDKARKSFSVPLEVLLVKGAYGTFWYNSQFGMFFELTHRNVNDAVLSLKEPLQRFASLSIPNRRTSVHLHVTVGTRHDPSLVSKAITELDLPGMNIAQLN